MCATLAIRLDGFCSLVALARQPEAKELPIVIHLNKIVLDTNLIARQAGLKPGRRLNEAKSLLGSHAVYVEYVPSHYEEAASSWLDHCIEVSNSVEPLGPDRAAVDVSRHPDPAQVANDLLAKLIPFAPLGLYAGLSLGKWHAGLSMTKVETLPLKLGVPVVEFVTDLPSLLAGSSVETMLALPSQVVEKLRRLGYKQVGQLATTSYRILQNQFGDQALLIHQMANGRHIPSPNAAYPPESMMENWDFDGPLDSRLALEQALRNLAASSSKRLMSKGFTAAGVLLTFETESGPVNLKKPFAKPLQTVGPMANALIQVVELAIDENFKPTRVRAIYYGLKRTHFVQKTLAERTTKMEHVATATQTAAAANTSFGAGTVLLASQVKSARRIEVLRAWQRATGWQ